MFSLSIELCSSKLDEAKKFLAKSIPQVKSSHRCEALARGLGFRTYASLRAALTSQSATKVVVSSKSFCSYLSDHAFDVKGASIYRAFARVALNSVLKQNPKLTADGMGIYARSSWGYESEMDFESRFALSRSVMLDEKADERFLLACAVLQGIPKTRTIREAFGFRRLKHIVENMVAKYPDNDPLGPQYLPAGFVLAAAIHEGFDWKLVRGLDGIVGPEVRFNMRKMPLGELELA